MKTIIIGVTSGIAAYKAIELVKSIKKNGFDVIVIMTEKAVKMAGYRDFEIASGHKVAVELFPKDFDYKKVLECRKVEHISLADKASLILVAPATANIIGKIANGIADDLLTTTIMATKAKVLLCPSMNVNMWNNNIMQENIDKLKEKGYYFVKPEKGMLACDYSGIGRLADIKKIQNEALKLVEKSKSLAGKKIIITAGGTIEEIDDVRVITNNSSGKMGIAIAEECSKRGADVVLIKAKTSVEPMQRMKIISVDSVDNMYKALKKEVNKVDYVFHAAAVGDFKVKDKLDGKIKSNGFGINTQSVNKDLKKINNTTDKIPLEIKNKTLDTKSILLELVPTKKIITEIKKWNKKIRLVGFKAESGKRLISDAKELMKRAKCDFVVANDISKVGFGKDESEVIILDKKWKKLKIKGKKSKIAEKLVDLACK